MREMPQYTAFAGQTLLATGAPSDVAVGAAKAMSDGRTDIIIFDDRTGRQIDLDLRGSVHEIASRYAPESQERVVHRGRGRPTLGVVSREVTLLPRHWEWLSSRLGGSSAALRRLIDAALKTGETSDAFQNAQQTADRFMLTMAGNEPGYEEASRALYAGDRAQFLALTEGWAADIKDHARKLAEGAFPTTVRTAFALRSLLEEQLQIAWMLADHHLKTLTTEEALWRPSEPCLHITRDIDGRWKPDWPETEDYSIGSPSIAWTTWHICYWWTAALNSLEGRALLLPHEVEWPGTAEFVREIISDLKRRWTTCLSSISDNDLLSPQKNSWPLPNASPAQIAAWVTVELTKNASEVGLIRFLYATHSHGNEVAPYE